MSSGSSAVPKSFANGRFEVDERLGAGCFSVVYRGREVPTGNAVAVKFEKRWTAVPQLQHEAEVLQSLAPHRQLPQGFSKLFYSGVADGQYLAMVLNVLGASLEAQVQSCGGNLEVPTTILVAEQAIRRIEYVHSRGILHRDIKPENFLLGLGNRAHHVHLIDFGLSKRYWVNGSHIGGSGNYSLTGTARYASINALKGYQQSRRDDLEAIGHMLLYFLRGTLPWSGLAANSQKEKYARICEKKERTPLKTLCDGFPSCFETYLTYCRGLAFTQRPDYDMLFNLFRDTREEMGPLKDYDLQWMKGSSRPEDLEVLDLSGGTRQPDDGLSLGSHVAQVAFSCCAWCR